MGLCQQAPIPTKNSPFSFCLAPFLPPDDAGMPTFAIG
jgi:hypothetical protein